MYCSCKEKRAKVTPTIDTDQSSAPEVVAITPDDSVDIRHTFASADTPPDTTPVLSDGWNAQDAAAHLAKRSWLLTRDDGRLVYSTCSEERVEVEPCWKELGAGVRSSGDNLRTKKSSLRNKMKRHNDSRAHQYVVSIIDKREKEVWKTCTDNVYFLAKSNRPFSDHPEIIRFAPLPLHKM